MVDTTQQPDSYAWNITRIGEAFGMSRDTVRKRLKAANCRPVDKIRGVPQYALTTVGPALFSAQATAEEISPNEMPPGDRKDWFDSELKREKLEEIQGQLVPVEDVAREMSTLIKCIVNPLDGLIDTLERKADLTDKQAGVVQREVDAVREQMYIASLNYADEDEDD